MEHFEQTFDTAQKKHYLNIETRRRILMEFMKELDRWEGCEECKKRNGESLKIHFVKNHLKINKIGCSVCPALKLGEPITVAMHQRGTHQGIMDSVESVEMSMLQVAYFDYDLARERDNAAFRQIESRLVILDEHLIFSVLNSVLTNRFIFPKIPRRREEGEQMLNPEDVAEAELEEGISSQSASVPRSRRSQSINCQIKINKGVPSPTKLLEEGDGTFGSFLPAKNPPSRSRYRRGKRSKPPIVTTIKHDPSVSFN